MSKSVVNVNSIIVMVALVFLSLSDYVQALTDSRDVKEIGIDERLGEVIPQDIILRNGDNGTITFNKLLPNDDKPTILSLVYYSCPRVCDFALKGLAQSVNELYDLSLGVDFRMLTVSFDHEDSWELANSKAIKLRGDIKRGQSINDNWQFLIGDKGNIKRLTQAVGFSYKKDGSEFAHASSLIILTPEGKIARYLPGMRHDPTDLRLALLEASQGKVGSSELLNKVLLFCYGFDPIGKRYALKALNVVKAGGVVTLLVLSGVLAYFWRREKNVNSNGGLQKDG